jgi:hypothetical protein
MKVIKIAISMYPQQLQALKELCLLEGRTVSNMIQRLVDQEMKKREKEIEKFQE